MKRNYSISPRNTYIDCSIGYGDVFLGSNGQCSLFRCQEWIGGVPHYPELVRDDSNGFVICPRCGVSYGRDALTGEEYKRKKPATVFTPERAFLQGP